MKFTVTWTTNAEQELTRLWLAGRDRMAIDEAVAAIESTLATNPLDAGESRSGNVRIVIVEPLVVLVSIRELDRLVKVVHVARNPWRQ
jgi:plasmid stabilization system protein ParE